MSVAHINLHMLVGSRALAGEALLLLSSNDELMPIERAAANGLNDLLDRVPFIVAGEYD